MISHLMLRRSCKMLLIKKQFLENGVHPKKEKNIFRNIRMIQLELDGMED